MPGIGIAVVKGKGRIIRRGLMVEKRHIGYLHIYLT
jgi:hypothetical protein